MAATGFRYYFDYAGLDEESYAVHYDFRSNGFTIPSIANPIFSGNYFGTITDGSGNFNSSGESDYFQSYSTANSLLNLDSDGNLTFSDSSDFDLLLKTDEHGYIVQADNAVVINNASGLRNDYWTQLFVYKKLDKTRLNLFNSLASGISWSGYSFGINDNNKFNFQYYNDNGPQSICFDSILSVNNIIGVVRSNNLVTLHTIDPINNIVNSESKFVDSKWTPKSNKAALGEGEEFQIILDEYIYLNDAVNASTLNILASGFYSYPQPLSGNVETYATTQVTGIEYFATGITGVTGFNNIITGSGIDSFGELYYSYTAVPLIGFITKGSGIRYLTGIVNTQVTGAVTDVLFVDKDFASNFGLDSYSTIIPLSGDFYVDFQKDKTSINKIARYDSVEKAYQFNTVYQDSEIQIYSSGKPEYSGLNYELTGRALYPNVYSPEILYDVISGQKQSLFVYSPKTHGQIENLNLSGDPLVFFNQNLLISGKHYSNISGKFAWATGFNLTQELSKSTFSMSDGYIVFDEDVSIMEGLFDYDSDGNAQPSNENEFDSIFQIDNLSNITERDYLTDIVFQSGLLVIFPNPANTIHSGVYCAGTSRLFLNGSRLSANKDYFETSSLSLASKTKIIESPTGILYNGTYEYFE